MRELMADWLEAAGYRVRQAATACCARRIQAAGAGAGHHRHVHARGVRGRGDRPAESRAARNRSHRGFRLLQLGHGLSAEAALSAGADRALPKPVKRGELIRQWPSSSARRPDSREMPTAAARSAASRITLTRALVALGAVLVGINVASAIWDARTDRDRTELRSRRNLSTSAGCFRSRPQPRWRPWTWCCATRCATGPRRK